MLTSGRVTVTPFDPPYLKTHAARKHHGSMFDRTAVTAGRIGIFDLFGSCDLDLDLDPMTFIYELEPYSLEIYRMCKYELLASRLRRQTYRVTDIQTQPKSYTTPLHGWSKMFERELRQFYTSY